MANAERIEPIRGEALRYYVASNTEGSATHIVDLIENDGNGECSCTDFKTRRGPNYYRGGKVIVDYYKDDAGKTGKDCTRCRHLNAAFLHLATTIAKDQSELQTKRTQPVTIKHKDDPTKLPWED